MNAQAKALNKHAGISMIGNPYAKNTKPEARKLNEFGFPLSAVMKSKGVVKASQGAIAVAYSNESKAQYGN